MRPSQSRLLAMSLAAAASLATSVPAAAWQTYVNDRFGATAEYPDIFSVPAEPPANSDGQRFFTADGRAELAVFGFFNALDQTPRQMMDARREAGTTYSYADAKATAFTLSGTRADRISYLRCIRSRASRDIFVCLELVYPGADARRFDPIVKRASASLRAGKPW